MGQGEGGSDGGEETGEEGGEEGHVPPGLGEQGPEGDPTTTTQFFSRQIKTNNVTTTIILTKMYPSI